MNKPSDHILLNELQAAALLQPHMRNKSALQWLQADREHKPVIPSHIFQGQYYYLENDLRGFIIRTLNPAARFLRISNRLQTDQRSKSDRRSNFDRRKNTDIALTPGIDRRRPGSDRRSNVLGDRRAQIAL